MFLFCNQDQDANSYKCSKSHCIKTVYFQFLMQNYFLAGKYRLRKGNLAPSMYFYLIKTESKAAYSGKLIIR